MLAGGGAADAARGRRRDPQSRVDRVADRADGPLRVFDEQGRGADDDALDRGRLRQAAGSAATACARRASIRRSSTDTCATTTRGAKKEMFKQLSEYQPIGRMAEPEEVAALALYLCSDEASFITGQAYPIDGGVLVFCRCSAYAQTLNLKDDPEDHRAVRRASSRGVAGSRARAAGDRHREDAHLAAGAPPFHGDGDERRVRPRARLGAVHGERPAHPRVAVADGVVPGAGAGSAPGEWWAEMEPVYASGDANG